MPGPVDLGTQQLVPHPCGIAMHPPAAAPPPLTCRRSPREWWPCPAGGPGRCPACLATPAIHAHCHPAQLAPAPSLRPPSCPPRLTMCTPPPPCASCTPGPPALQPLGLVRAVQQAGCSEGPDEVHLLQRGGRLARETWGSCSMAAWRRWAPLNCPPVPRTCDASPRVAVAAPSPQEVTRYQRVHLA